MTVMEMASSVQLIEKKKFIDFYTTDAKSVCPLGSASADMWTQAK